MNEDLVKESDDNVTEINASDSESSKEDEQTSEAKTDQEQEETVEVEAEEGFKEKFLYLAAEMENMKKRFEREREDLLKYGSEKILRGLLDVIDNLERSIDAVKNDDDEKVKNIVVGLDMVLGMFSKTLAEHGLKEVETEGKAFDPHVHEAMGQQEVEGVEANTVVSVFQKGYTLNGRLIRAAKVMVAK